MAKFQDVAAHRGAPSTPRHHSGWSLRIWVSMGRVVVAISSGSRGGSLRAESDQKWLSFIRMEQ